MSQELRDQLAETVGELERIAELPTEVATVIEVQGDHVQASSGHGSFALKKPRAPMKVGDQILVNAQSKQYIEHSPFLKNQRVLGYVGEMIGDHALVEIEGRKKLVPVLASTQPGDKVLLDSSMSVILEVVEPPADKPLVTGVCWDDIGGNYEAKQVLVDAVENSYKQADLYAYYGAKTTGGILLVGPPGCGKTMLAKACATSIGSEEGFISCKGPEVLDPYVGVAEATVRSLFARAKKFKARTGHRAIIFVDEAEAILGDRNARHAHMEKTIVPMFLAEMDGMDESAATVILATNRGMNLDSAVVRPGRIDTKVLVSRPNPDECQEILLTYLAKTPCVDDQISLAEKTVIALWGMSFENAGNRHAAHEHVSGSLLAGVIEQARHSAMRRDIADGTRTGIGIRDIGYGLAHEIKALTLVALDTHYN